MPLLLEVLPEMHATIDSPNPEKHNLDTVKAEQSVAAPKETPWTLQR